MLTGAILASLLAAASPFDGGGNLFNYEVANFTNTAPITGICLSACTVRLSTARCIDRNAQLGFHAPRDPDTGAYPPLGLMMLVSHYKPRLRAWFMAGDIATLRVLRGAQLARFGYRVCK